jgi:NADH dehydrogenase
LKQLQNDNVVADHAKTLGDLGIEATSMASILPDYLWCYRPSGQYAAIKDSAKNLKSS